MARTESAVITDIDFGVLRLSSGKTLNFPTRDVDLFTTAKGRDRRVRTFDCNEAGNNSPGVVKVPSWPSRWSSFTGRWIATSVFGS